MVLDGGLGHYYRVFSNVSFQADSGGNGAIWVPQHVVDLKSWFQDSGVFIWLFRIFPLEFCLL